MKDLHGRRRSRAQALQLLFQAEMTAQSISSLLTKQDYALEDGPLDEYAGKLALAAYEQKEHFDQMIDKVSDNWSIDRLPLVDRCLLHMALAEISSAEFAETSVAIDEAVELSKRYGTDNSYRYINGILGQLVRSQSVHSSEDAELVQTEADQDDNKAGILDE